MKSEDQDRAAIIHEQCTELVKLLADNRNKLELREIILAHKFPGDRTIKPEAIKLALDTHGATYSKHQIRSLKEALIAKKIGKVKHGIELEHVREKDGGVVGKGKVVKRPNKDKDIMQKSSESSGDGKLLGQTELVVHNEKNAREGLASNLFSAMSVAGLSVESPKVRYHVAKDGKVSLLSTYLESFVPSAEIVGERGKETLEINSDFKVAINDPEKSARFSVGNFLIGETDFTPSNISADLRRIDFGEALNYYPRLSPESSLENYFTALMQSGINSEIFSGRSFSEGVLNVTREINLDLVRYGVQLSIKNMQEAYGPEFMNNSDFKKECEFSFGIDPQRTLTPAILEEEFMKKYVDRIDQLETYACKTLGIERPVKENPPRERPENITLDNAASYLDELARLVKDPGANADRISEIKSLKSDQEQDFSLLKYAYSSGRTSLAIELRHQYKFDFTLSESEQPEKITKANASVYLDELEYLAAAQKNYYSKANADRISEIKSLQPGSEGSTVESEQDFSLLKYALSTGRKELAVELATKHSFSLNQSEPPDPRNKQALLDSNNLIRRTLKLLTATDKKREEVIKNTPSKILAGKGIDLKKKPSPLFIAIKLGKTDLASEMLGQGFVLKQSEINSFLKEQDKKQGIRSSLGFRKRKRSEEIIEAIKTSNLVLPNTRKSRDSVAAH